MTQTLPLAFGLPGGMEWVIIGLVALLIFGNRLPKVARYFGQAMHEFKSGLNGAIDDKNDKEAKDAGGKSDDQA